MKNILTIVFLFFYFISFGQNYNKLIEKGKYSKVYKKCKKGLSKKPNDVLLNYFKSTVQSKKEASSLYNPEDAYILCLKTSTDFLNETDFKKLEAFSKIPLSNSLFINLIDTISRNALDDAIRSNSIDEYDAYINYYGEAPQIYIDKAFVKRNIVAFDQAKSKNKVEAYQYFIDTYPDAVQYDKAIEFRNEVAFNNAKEENTISSYQNFIDKYPDAIQLEKAVELRNELAFDVALKTNTSAAYYSFITDYPNAVQYSRAFGLYEQRQYEENIVEDDWNSYARFIENFPNNSWVIKAQDNVYSLGKMNKNVEALKYCADHFNLNTNYSNFLISYHFWATLDGEKESIDMFHKNYFLPEYEITDYELVDRTNKLNLDDSYKSSMDSLCSKFIIHYAPKDIAFVALQRKLSPLIKHKKWGEAIKELEKYLPKFKDNDRGILNLLEVLKEELDSKIIVKSLSKKVNTKYGKEYSPIISADDKNIYFCGKERIDNKGGEDVFVAKRNGKGWNTPKVINALSQEDKNDAPLAISADGNQIVLFEDGDLFISKKARTGWSQPERLPDIINTDNWEGDAGLSGDGKSLIFVRSANSIQDYEIIFLLDATGSMSPCIDGVKNNVKKFLKSLSESNPKSEIKSKVMYYRDAIMDTYDNYGDNSFTNNGDDLRLQLSNIRVNGGGDEPESTFESIYRSIQESAWSKNSTKIIVCFTDASNKNIYSDSFKRNYGSFKIEKFKDFFDSRKNDFNLFLYAQKSEEYEILADVEKVKMKLYDDAVYELNNADFSDIMKEISQEISLLGDKSRIKHGDHQINGDIHISNKNEDGSWSEPFLISDSINTPYSERTPFLHPDLKTLYFSSDGHGSLGKLDVYKSTRLADSCWNCWSTPVNMGKEINTIESDWGYKISTDGKTAYFSKRIGDSDNEDIFTLKIPKHLRPDMVAQISGKIVDSEDNGIETDLRWEDLATGEIIGEAKSDPSDGSYFIVLPLGKNYGYFVDNEDYFPLSNNLNLTEMESAMKLSNDVKILSIDEMIKDGTPVPMNNLFFDFAKSNLLKESIPELKRVAEIIKSKNLKIELSGHTDNIGNDKDNQKLSKARANSARDYLISIGCNGDYIDAKGYGSEIPVETNSTSEGRAKNRRVEIKITGIN